MPLLAIALGASIVQAIRGASRATFPTPVSSPVARAQRYALTALLHFLQPVARLQGRLQWGLSPWRHTPTGLIVPRVRIESAWSEHWRDAASWLADIERDLRERGVIVLRGGDFDRWDLELRRGLFASTKVMLAIEEHGGGRQLARLRMWPRFSRVAAVIASACIGVAILAWDAAAHIPAIVLGGIFFGIVVRTLQECASTMKETAGALHAHEAPLPLQPDLIGDLPAAGSVRHVNRANRNGSRADAIIDPSLLPTEREWTPVAERA